jgi:hypothetical protein
MRDQWETKERGVGDRELTPVEASFDDLARGLGAGSLSRRRALAVVRTGVLGSVLGSLALANDADAKKKKKKKKKKKRKNNDDVQPPPNPAPVGVVTSCANPNTLCGLGTNTLICVCELSKEGTQICGNAVNPPNGAAFQPCQQSANCPTGQFCTAIGGFCLTACQTA